MHSCVRAAQFVRACRTNFEASLVKQTRPSRRALHRVFTVTGACAKTPRGLGLVGGKTHHMPADIAAHHVADGVRLPASLRNARKLPSCQLFAQVFDDNFFVMPTFGEGSCFFHALAAAICKGYDHITDAKERTAVGLQLRESVQRFANEQMYHDAVTYLQQKHQQHRNEHPSRAPPVPEIPSYREFKQRLKQKAVWADLVMISFVAFTFGFNLLFFSNLDCKFYYGCDRLETMKNKFPTVFILWRDRTHFELIVRVSEDGTVERQFYWPKDARLLERVQAEYMR